MMNLHETVTATELSDETKFDFLQGVRDKLLRVDDDLEREMNKQDWSYSFLPNTGDGLIILSTWF